MSICKQLNKILGGKWKYSSFACGWDCDDGKRSIRRCSAGVDEFDNDVGCPQYWLYDEDKIPQRAESFLELKV